MRLLFKVLGCRLNASEMEMLARRFLAAGQVVVAEEDEPVDVCILNSCAVTNEAARKTRRLIRHLRRQHPTAFLVVTGCYAHLSPENVSAIGADLVVNNVEKERLFDTLQERLGDSARIKTDLTVSGGAGLLPQGHTRAFVKAQDGCDQRCAYCIVTVLRGRSRSRPTEDVVDEVKQLVAAGYKEVVLSGVHLGAFGNDLGGGTSLVQLVTSLLQETDVSRLRLSSLEPWDIPKDFFDLWRDERLGRHLHLPLQSGCDATLRRMGRQADADSFGRLLECARAAIPDLSVTTDIMVGFPGETEKEFEQSLAFVVAQRFSGLHVFRFSPRPGTKAATMPNRVSDEDAVVRSLRMHQEGKRMQAEFQRGFVGRTMRVLWESSRGTDTGLRWDGLTDNYLRVNADGAPGLRNTITPVLIEGRSSGELRGRIVE